MKAAAREWNGAEAAKAANFDGLARVYRWMELFSFGPWLWRCRCAFLSQLGDMRDALVIGDGDGRFTARLLAENESVTVNAVDVSAKMLAELRENAGGNASRVRLHCADVRTWNPGAEQYDLIVTHFVLDCLTTEEVAALANRLKRSVAPGARWILSDFAVPQNWFGLVIARPMIAALYLAFKKLTGLEVSRLPDHRMALTEAGFTRARTRHLLCGLLLSEIWIPDQPESKRHAAH